MKTSWENSTQWYDPLVGKEGHYYHQHTVIPGVLKLLGTPKELSILDLACGQGILSRKLPPQTSYCGIDLSHSLIKAAKSYEKNSLASFYVGDICKPLPIQDRLFSHCVCILALQNVETPQKVFSNAYAHLHKKGFFIFVINHPCFRIPRQSHWGVDEKNKLQYRRMDMYLSPLKIPIQTHPGSKENSPQTWSFHYPLSTYTQWLHENNFSIVQLEEWASDKISVGKNAKMENRARKEFPLFLAIKAQKL